MPVSQQLRIPLVSLETRHLTKMGQAKERVKYIQDRYDSLTSFLVKTWEHAPLPQHVQPQVLNTKLGADRVTRSNKKPKLATARAGSGPPLPLGFSPDSAALQAEPKEFQAFLHALYTRAKAVQAEMDLHVQHGCTDQGEQISEDELTKCMVNGNESLSVALHNASFQYAFVHHQKRLDEGRPDIVITNVSFPTHPASAQLGNLPIVVEVKKLQHGTFNSPGCRKRCTNQVRDYRNELFGSTGPSPYSVLINFEVDTLRVELLWSKYDASKPVSLEWQ
jgi:hypothetical protein